MIDSRKQCAKRMLDHMWTDFLDIPIYYVHAKSELDLIAAFFAWMNMTAMKYELREHVVEHLINRVILSPCDKENSV